MNYVISIYDKIIVWIYFFGNFENVGCLKMYFCIVGVFCVLYYKLLFLMRLSVSVNFSVYRNIF